MQSIQQDAHIIIKNTLTKVMPDTAVKNALTDLNLSGRIFVVSIGKAGWTMAKAASEVLPHIEAGIVLTKYNHAQGEIPKFSIMEAGHPIMDENSIHGAETILDMVTPLTKEDTVLLLLSGGGSALFEKPMGNLDLSDLQEVTKQLLACGANIVEINTIRKHLSAVKGGRFAECCFPASIYVIALSDILGDALDSIASGPAAPDTSTCADALKIVEKYQLQFSPMIMEQLQQETPKTVQNVTSHIIGSVSQLCQYAAEEAEKLGYTPLILSTMLDCEAREAGRFLGSMAQTLEKETNLTKKPCAIICGGETIVHVTGSGKGGRNQELALASAPYLEGKQALIAAVGSDGTDGPTDAAGGIADGTTMEKLRQANISVDETLAENDAYHALKKIDSLIITGPTGTNVNDLYFLLYHPK